MRRKPKPPILVLTVHMPKGLTPHQQAAYERITRHKAEALVAFLEQEAAHMKGE